MTNYIPDTQDIVWLDFNPTQGHKIKQRRPAWVLRHQEYSRLINLVVICPITHAINGSLQSILSHRPSPRRRALLISRDDFR